MSDLKYHCADLHATLWRTQTPWRLAEAHTVHKAIIAIASFIDPLGEFVAGHGWVDDGATKGFVPSMKTPWKVANGKQKSTH